MKRSLHSEGKERTVLYLTAAVVEEIPFAVGILAIGHIMSGGQQSTMTLKHHQFFHISVFSVFAFDFARIKNLETTHKNQRIRLLPSNIGEDYCGFHNASGMGRGQLSPLTQRGWNKEMASNYGNGGLHLLSSTKDAQRSFKRSDGAYRQGRINVL